MTTKASLPHARGGVSNPWQRHHDGTLSSPRPWGCFQSQPDRIKVLTVFPTPVGVFLTRPPAGSLARGLPHARGGVSDYFLSHVHWWGSSPRPWGCFLPCPKNYHANIVFPTPVGVFLVEALHGVVKPGLPHARGGVSQSWFFPALQASSSPRPWGCFSSGCGRGCLLSVFPTPVGVFLRPLFFCV